MMVPWCVQVSDVPQQLMELGIKSTSCQPMLLQTLQRLPHLQREMQASSSKLAALEAELSSAWARYQALQDDTKQLELRATKLYEEKLAAAAQIAARENKVRFNTHPMSAADTAWVQPSTSSLRD